MVVMSTLAAALIAAFGFRHLFNSGQKGRLLAAALLVLLTVEYLPSPLPTNQFPIPEYVRILGNLPGNEAVLDTVSPMGLALYYQTIHGRPMAFGYISRLPRSVKEKAIALQDAIARNDLASIRREYRIRYYVVRANSGPDLEENPNVALVWSGANVKLLDLNPRAAPL